MSRCRAPQQWCRPAIFFEVRRDDSAAAAERILVTYASGRARWFRPLRAISVSQQVQCNNADQLGCRRPPPANHSAWSTAGNPIRRSARFTTSSVYRARLDFVDGAQAHSCAPSSDHDSRCCADQPARPCGFAGKCLSQLNVRGQTPARRSYDSSTNCRTAWKSIARPAHRLPRRPTHTERTRENSNTALYRAAYEGSPA